MGVNKVVFGAVSIMDISDSTVTADTLAKGKTAYDKAGEKITGTMESGIDTSDATAVASEILSGKTAYAKGAKVTGTMPTQTLPTPSIEVSSGGLITAKDTLSASGYVASGTKSATKQLTTQAAKTITPSTSSQTAVASGRYTTGAVTVAAIPSSYVKPSATKSATTYTPTTSNQTIAAGTYCSGVQTIKGDSNLVAGNIKSGVSIFGVAGSYEGSGGGSVEFGTFRVYGYGYENKDYVFPFIIGMTWGEWVESPMNMQLFIYPIAMLQFYIYNNRIRNTNNQGFTGDLSVDGTSSGIITLTDTIQDGVTYSIYVESGGFPF